MTGTDEEIVSRIPRQFSHIRKIFEIEKCTIQPPETVGSTPSSVWTPTAANVAERLREIERWEKGARAEIDYPKLAERMKAEVAKKDSPPAWIRRTSWIDDETGVEIALFGVGVISGTKTISATGLAEARGEPRSRVYSATE